MNELINVEMLFEKKKSGRKIILLSLILVISMFLGFEKEAKVQEGVPLNVEQTYELPKGCYVIHTIVAPATIVVGNMAFFYALVCIDKVETIMGEKVGIEVVEKMLEEMYPLAYQIGFCSFLLELPVIIAICTLIITVLRFVVKIIKKKIYCLHWRMSIINYSVRYKKQLVY